VFTSSSLGVQCSEIRALDSGSGFWVYGLDLRGIGLRV
jgi:hypothetical protein